jgi:hypothetical protein
MLSIGWTSLKLTRSTPGQASLEELVQGYNSVRTFSAAEQKAWIEEYKRLHPGSVEPVKAALAGESEFVAPSGYDARVDHFRVMFRAMRGGDPVVEDAEFGLRAAAPALMANLCYLDDKIYHWDPKAMVLKT